MPITEFQKTILTLLRQHRNPNSYVAGGIAIHRHSSSSRHSNDIDFFHDTDEAVTLSAQDDIQLLQKNGYTVSTSLQQPSFVRAVVKRDDSSVKLEWVRDTAFRFFPVLEDADLGYRLHDVDLAVNKCLALANRSEVRDIIDLIQIHTQILALSAVAWAACGKDPGFTPGLIFDCMRRHSIIRPEQLEGESLVHPITPAHLKREWMELMDTEEDLVRAFPATDIGCLYLDVNGSVAHNPALTKRDSLYPHFGTIGGSWPRIVQDQ